MVIQNMDGHNINSDDERQQTFDIIGNLPPEIVQEISLYLSGRDLANAWNCSTTWRMLLNLDYYWMKRCQQKKYSKPPTLAIYQKWLKKFKIYWKAVYYSNQLLNNLTNANFRRTNIDSEGQSNVKLYSFDDEKLFISTMGYAFKCINQITGIVTKIKFEISENVIAKLVPHKNWVIALCWNLKHVTVYNFETQHIEFTRKFNNEIADVIAYKNIIGVRDYERNFYIINIITKKIEYTDSNIKLARIEDNKIIVVKQEGIIGISGLNYNHLINFQYDQDDVIDNLTTNEEYLICQTHNSTLRFAHVYNLKDLVYLYRILLRDVVRDWNLLCYNNSNCLHKNNTFTYPEKSEHVLTTYLTMDLSTQVSLFKIGIDLNDMVISMKSNESLIFMMMESYTINLWCLSTGNKITEIHDIFPIPFYVTDTKFIGRDLNHAVYILDYEIDME